MNEIKVPNHVAIIMDGNGRWAKNQGKKRSMGHKAGADNLKKLTKHIFESGVNYLSVFAFSTENFKRSEEEVNYLMNLFFKMFKGSIEEFNQNNIRVVFSGRKEPLSDSVYEAMQKLSNDTKNNTGGVFNICLNYGGQAEIVDATKEICQKVLNKELDINDINEETYYKYMYKDLPPIDLMIRTSGEYRISNFMLYQLSYAELIFTNVYFPDFNEQEFDKALEEYTKRDRRFGNAK